MRHKQDDPVRYASVVLTFAVPLLKFRYPFLGIVAINGYPEQCGHSQQCQTNNMLRNTRYKETARHIVSREYENEEESRQKQLAENDARRNSCKLFLLQVYHVHTIKIVIEHFHNRLLLYILVFIHVIPLYIVLQAIKILFIGNQGLYIFNSLVCVFQS